MAKGYIENEELIRAQMLVYEIDEVHQPRAYTGYLNEKLSGIITDINCLKSIVDEN